MFERRVRDAVYILGASELEQERLRAQADAVGPMTERLLLQAGIGPGMTVLDAGCGSGDVSLLIARLVGPEGRVVGIEERRKVDAVYVGGIVFGAWARVPDLLGEPVPHARST